ncbi:DUF6710 family protein [Burkholderia gladioli]|uniref:DUF6710 family protein n=1 Tax=Burkholderia gladioli TaxID=28095 RepID=UPI00163E1B8E|nr:DUF6710 family protein [Burkholderia gladioli]
MKKWLKWFNGEAAPKAARRRQKSTFQQLMETARAIAETNPRGLKDLVRAVLLPYQDDYLLAVAEEGTDARPNFTPELLFGRELVTRMLFENGGMRCVSLPRENFRLELAKDPVFPWPWKHDRYVSALALIGESKIDRDDPWRRRSAGAWREDDNHSVTLWLPWGIGFVYGGNHSIAAGILAGEGTLSPRYVYDMSYVFSEFYTDGTFYRERQTDRVVSLVASQRAAALFEMGRLMHETGFPAHRDVLSAI